MINHTAEEQTHYQSTNDETICRMPQRRPSARSERCRAWFETSKSGLSKIAKERGPARIVTELVSNALDEEGVSRIDVVAKPVKGRPFSDIRVEDNSPAGFHDLSHSFTLFADSYKRKNPEQRGQFNFGEKLFLSLCESATVTSTTGTVHFSKRSGRMNSRKKRERGSAVTGRVWMSRSELTELERLIKALLLPDGVELTYNGVKVAPRKPVRLCEVTLPTFVADEEGVMRTTSRKTSVGIFEPMEGESALIYEMGIPVVETNDRWHYDVRQKVPQNLDRNNVTPAYLWRLRVAVLNECHDLLSDEDVNANWVRESASDPHCSKAATETVFRLRHGEKVVAATPSDPESAKQAVARGYTVIYGNQMSSGERENAKNAGLLPSSASLFPSPKPYSADPNAPAADLIPPHKWSDGMRLVANYARMLAIELMDGLQINVRMVKTNNAFVACYGGKRLDFNVRHLGEAWFSQGITEAVDELIIHELGHEFAADHLSEEYYDALCKLGARLKRLALGKPSSFEAYL